MNNTNIKCILTDDFFNCFLNEFKDLDYENDGFVNRITFVKNILNNERYNNIINTQALIIESPENNNLLSFKDILELILLEYEAENNKNTKEFISYNIFKDYYTNFDINLLKYLNNLSENSKDITYYCNLQKNIIILIRDIFYSLNIIGNSNIKR